MAGKTRWVTEHDVIGTLDLSGAIEALRAGFAAEGAGSATAMEKTMLAFDGADGGHGTLHALGAALPGDGLVGTKTWAHTPGGADPALLLFDAETGALQAVVEAFALGQLRTAGTAALATDLLARGDAARLGVIGTGKQALAQVAAVVNVRPITSIRVFSRDPARRQAFAVRVADELGVDCSAADSPDATVEGADVITLVTRATSPVLTAAMVAPGVHINAVGAIDLQRQEFEPALLGDCAAVVTDSLPQVRNFSSEFRQHYGTDPAAWAAVRTLGEIVAGGVGDRDPESVTLFKGMGSGLEDLALGAAILRRVTAEEPSTIIQRGGRADIGLARAPASYR